MDQIVKAFACSTLLSLLFTPPTIYLAKKFKLVDDPKARPHPAHIHSKVIARAGGLPVFLAIVISILIFIPFDQTSLLSGDNKHILGILIGITILLIVGLLDDYLKDFSPYPRLFLQLLAAGVVVASGVGISFVTSPLGGILRLDEIVIPINLFGSHTIVLIADIFAFLWIVWMMNMVNWSKGVDGQMPGIAVVAALTIGYLSFGLFTKGDPNQFPIAVLSAITAGAALAFLVFNWHPAKIFPGQSCSTILGFMIAVLSILSGAKLATALLVLLIPSIDFFYTFFRRAATKKSPFRGDKKHLHHLLLERGWSHKKISLFYIVSCAILGLLAISLPSQGKLFAALGIGVVVLGGLLWLHLFGRSFERSDPDNG